MFFIQLTYNFCCVVCVLVAHGPRFKPGRLIAPLAIVDVYALLCELLAIECHASNGTLSAFADALHNGCSRSTLSSSGDGILRRMGAVSSVWLLTAAGYSSFFNGSVLLFFIDQLLILPIFRYLCL